MSENHTMITTMHQIKVRELLEPLNAKESYIEQAENLENVFLLLSKKDHIWVIDDRSSLQIVGVITESDIIPLFAQPYTPLQSFDKPSLHSFYYGVSMTAEDIMSKQPITICPEETIAEVIMKMKQHRIKQLPVIDETKRLFGEITMNHLIREYLKRYAAIHQKEKIKIP